MVSLSSFLTVFVPRFSTLHLSTALSPGPTVIFRFVGLNIGRISVSPPASLVDFPLRLPTIESSDSRGICQQTKTSSFGRVTLESMHQYIFSFARKATLQQLPTASNLHRWKKISSPVCNLCNSDMVQTNKHVMNNCSNAKALGTIQSTP